MPAHSSSLLDFARTGRLGPIAIGMSRSEVRSILGPPTDWSIGCLDEDSTNNVETAPVWKYGDAEIYFGDDEIWLIHFDWFTVPTCGPILRLDPWIIRSGLPLADLETALRNEGIQFESAPYIDPACIGVLTEGGVRFVVQTEIDEFQTLGLAVFGKSDLPFGGPPITK